MPLLPVPEAPAPEPEATENFAAPGGVDELARPRVQPEFVLPREGTGKSGWKVQFDLLIDAEGKVVRVENVEANAPTEVVGAVLASFYTLPFEPARLAGQPVASRQRFEVQP